MTRKLATLGLALTLALALTAISTTTAGAVEEKTLPAEIHTYAGDEETAKVDGESVGTIKITIGSLPSLECATAKYNGEAVTPGPVTEKVTISPEYKDCHVEHIFLGTRTATVTMNGCGLLFTMTATITESGEEHLSADTNIECPEGKKIEVHVYNTSSESDSGASTLCKFDIAAQSNLKSITLTNKINTPTAVNDILANVNLAGISVTRTTGAELTCGKESQTATYKDEATLQSTSTGGKPLEAQTTAKKRFTLGSPPTLAIGEGGKAEITTEKLNIACTGVKYNGTYENQYLTVMSLSPAYPTCTATGGLTTHVDFKECWYKHYLIAGRFGDGTEGPTGTAKGETHTKGPMDIECPPGVSILITVTKEGKQACTITISEQSTSGVVDTKNFLGTKGSENYVKFTNTVEKISYIPEGDPNTCGKNQVLSDGKLHGEVDVKGYVDKGGEPPGKGTQTRVMITGEAAP
jgi:hypothetical protein